MSSGSEIMRRTMLQIAYAILENCQHCLSNIDDNRKLGVIVRDLYSLISNWE